MTAAGAARTRGGAPTRLVVVAMLGLVYLLWGATFPAVQVAVATFPPQLMSGLRFLLAGVVLVAVLTAVRGRSALRLTARQAAGTVLIAACMLPAANGLLALGQRSVPAGLAAVLGASTPCWIIVLQRLHGERIRPLTAAGVLLGLLGVLVLFAPAGGGPVGVAGLLLVAGASLLWALGSFLVPRLPLHPDALTSAAQQMVVGGALGLLVGLAAGERVPAVPPPAAAWWAFGFLVVLGSLAGFTAYTWLLVHAPPTAASTVAYGAPVVAVVLGVLLLDETVTGSTLVGGTAVLLSCIVVVTAERRGAGERPLTRTPDPTTEPGIPSPGR